MIELDGLRAIADDLSKSEWCMGLSAALHKTLEDIARETEDISGYESDVLAWVEKNGGLDAVKEQRRESIPRAVYERKKAGWLDHIEECEEALARRNGRISELRRERDKLRDEAAWAESLSEILDEWADLLGFPEQKGDPGKITARVGAVLDGTWRRLMPEGMEWPRFEDGEPVRLGEHWEEDGFDESVTRIDSIEFAEDGIRFENEYADAFYRYGERVKRPAPKALDADGAEIEVGDDLYSVEGGLKLHVGVIDTRNGKIATAEMYALDKWADPAMYTHRAPAIAADGKPLREGETVWRVRKDMGRLEFFEYEHPWARVKDEQGEIHGLWPDDLTHERPAADTWERLEEDANKAVCIYFGVSTKACSECDHNSWECSFDKDRDLVRRAKALAERGE